MQWRDGEDFCELEGTSASQSSLKVMSSPPFHPNISTRLDPPTDACDNGHRCVPGSGRGALLCPKLGVDGKQCLGWLLEGYSPLHGNAKFWPLKICDRYSLC